MRKNVDFKHSFNLVVLSREQVSSCNHTSVIHQDGDVANVLLHLLDRNKTRKLCVICYEKKCKVVEDLQQLI